MELLIVNGFGLDEVGAKKIGERIRDYLRFGSGTLEEKPWVTPKVVFSKNYSLHGAVHPITTSLSGEIETKDYISGWKEETNDVGNVIRKIELASERFSRIIAMVSKGEEVQFLVGHFAKREIDDWVVEATKNSRSGDVIYLSDEFGVMTIKAVTEVQAEKLRKKAT